MKVEKRLHLTRGLPSSNFTELGGVIPQEEFCNFVWLMLLYRFPFWLADPTPTEIDTAANAILTSFALEVDESKDKGISWSVFDQALRGKVVSKSFSSWNYLLT
jgi:hypothetical protein